MENICLAVSTGEKKSLGEVLSKNIYLDLDLICEKLLKIDESPMDYTILDEILREVYKETYTDNDFDECVYERICRGGAANTVAKHLQKKNFLKIVEGSKPYERKIEICYEP